MSGQEVLNQDEIDALLNGVDQGAVSTEPAAPPGEARQYDFSREMRIVRGRMPTLEMVNERFARQHSPVLAHVFDGWHRRAKKRGRNQQRQRHGE